MAVQNALVQISLANTPATSVMTTNVTHFMLHLGEAVAAGGAGKAAEACSRAMRILPVILGFTIGCGLGAACQAAAGLWSLALPTGLALLAWAMIEVGKPGPLPADTVVVITREDDGGAMPVGVWQNITPPTVELDVLLSAALEGQE